MGVALQGPIRSRGTPLLSRGGHWTSCCSEPVVSLAIQGKVLPRFGVKAQTPALSSPFLSVPWSPAGLIRGPTTKDPLVLLAETQALCGGDTTCSVAGAEPGDPCGGVRPRAVSPFPCENVTFIMKPSLCTKPNLPALSVLGEKWYLLHSRWNAAMRNFMLNFWKSRDP